MLKPIAYSRHRLKLHLAVFTFEWKGGVGHPVLKNFLIYYSAKFDIYVSQKEKNLEAFLSSSTF